MSIPDSIKISMNTTQDEAFALLKSALIRKVKMDNPETEISESDEFLETVVGVAQSFFETGIEFGKKEALLAIMDTCNLKNLGH